MKKNRPGKTSYKAAYLGLIATCFLAGAASMIIFGGKRGVLSDRKAEQNAVAAPFNASLADRAKGTISKEEYEALTAEDYKKSGGMVKFGNYRQRFEVRKTTLFIGTYLIEFDALNDTYYRLANISKKQRKQDIEFYKSELMEDGSNKGYEAEDVWTTLTGADLSTLSGDIRNKEEELDGYWISAVVTADGAYDPMTGEKKDVMDDSLYDLMNLPELIPLKNAYDEIEEKTGRTEDEEIHNYYTRNIMIATDDAPDAADADLFQSYEDRGRSDLTNRCDVEITALKAYQEKLAAGEDEISAEKAAAVLDLYAREDARRHAEIYKFLAIGTGGRKPALTALSEAIEDRKNREGSESFEPIETYISAIDQSLENCKNSYYMYLEMVPTPGTTVLSEYRFNVSVQILDLAYDSKLEAEADDKVSRLLAAEHIGAGEVKDAELETVVLETALLPEGIKRFEDAVLTEVTKEYTEAVLEGRTEDEKKSILMDQYSGAEKQLFELEFLVKSTTDRITAEESADLIEEQVLLAYVWKSRVFDDPYGPLAEFLIDKYIDWLKQLYESITGEPYTGDEYLDDLYGKKLRAEEEDDPERLRQLEILESDYNKRKIGKNTSSVDESLIKRRNDFWDSLKTKTTTGIIDDLKKRAGDDDANGNHAIRDAVDRASKDDKKNRRENENFAEKFGGDGLDGSGGGLSGFEGLLGTDTGLGEGDLTDSQIEDLINSLFGCSFDDLSADAQAAVVVALNRYGVMHNAENILNYARKLLTKIMNSKNPLVYAKYEADKTEEYVSMGAVDFSRSFTGYRYVTEDGTDTLSQTGGAASYSFKDNRVTSADGSVSDLTASVGYQSDGYIKQGTRFAYISEKDAASTTGMNAEYIKDTDWAVLVTPKMEVEVTRIMDAIAEMAEGSKESE